MQVWGVDITNVISIISPGAFLIESNHFDIKYCYDFHHFMQVAKILRT